jgi:uncharacterized protein YbaP (TraB family)
MATLVGKYELQRRHMRYFRIKYSALPTNINQLMFKLKVVLLLAFSIISATSKAASESVTAVKVTSQKGLSSIVIGTVHLAPRDILQADPSILAGKLKLLVENDSNVSHPPILDDRASSPGDNGVIAPWVNSLSIAEIKILSRRGTCNGNRFPITHYLSLVSPYSAENIAWTPCDIRTSYYMPDYQLQETARNHGLPIVSLDDDSFRKAAYRAVPPDAFLDSLKVALSKDLPPLYRAGAESISRGNFDEIKRTSGDAFTNPVYAEIFWRELVTNRNKMWMKTLIPNLEQGNVVVVVGAAHLPGEDGLLRLIEKNGFSISKVQIPGYYPVINP